MKATHLLAAAIFTALILACLAAPAAAFSGAGSGTAASPYIITTPAQLQSMQDDLDAYYQLGNDIDLSGFSWSPVGTSSAPFTGTLDGNGYSITNLILNNYEFSGLFSYIENSQLKNLRVSNFKINYNLNSYSHVGLLAGWADGTCTFENCIGEYSELTGSRYMGGFVAYISGDVTFSNCLINGVSYTHNAISTIAYSNGIGGFATVDTGANANIINSFINDCSFTIANSKPFTLGGFSSGTSHDSMTMSITNSVNLADIFPYSSSSGRIGTTYKGTGVTVSNCYALDTITGFSPIGTSTKNGADVSEATIHTQSFWQNTLGWDFTNTWYWDEAENLPKLQVFRAAAPPTISAISATPATGGQQTEYTLSVSATTEAAGGITGYQWSYSTDSGTTWQAITGATAATYIWTPGTTISGTVLLKCYITGADGGTVDSYEAGYTNIQITVYPPPDISTISVSRPLQKVNTPTTLTATLTESEPATYQWYYSTNGGTTWQPISGATALTAEYTPTTTGTHSVKIVVTNQYGESNELTTNFNVLPTYTPTQISNTSVDINIPGTAKYQGQTQFTLSAELKALEYFDTDRAHLAHDNALYYLDSAERQIIPLAATTGNTISSCYIGQNTGVITDISGNTAFHDYQTNTWQYIEQLSADIMASTTTYAATISGTTLNLYNLNGNKVDDIETTLTNLAGNDAANTFAGYSGNTLTYYWLSGNQLSLGSQTLAHTITDVHQVPGTENYVVSTTANTYIVSISNTGAYSQVMETETADPLLHTQATTINVLIGVSDPNEIYVVGSDGETDGTYVSGSTLTDASIAKSTGLYAIAGGADFQAYILGKSESSTWQLTQVISFGEGVDFSQISTTGTYAAVATGLKLYLLEAVDVSTGTYMLQGVIIGSSGNPYAGKLISINGDQIRTDTSGRFLYPVTPNTLYTIVADTTTTEYTATSAALQQIAIRLKPNPFAQSVSYSATYNEDTGNFEMLYEDSRDLTQQVTWTIRETGDNTIVHQVTVQPGQTATWQVPFDKVFQGYQISMDAERGSINVENVWMITPAGSQPINIPGLDDTGKNIIFGCVLMIIAGLFGVMFSTKGAIFVVLAAGVMTFLGLLTIPWEIIIVAGLLAFLAALAKGGGQ